MAVTDNSKLFPEGLSSMHHTKNMQTFSDKGLLVSDKRGFEEIITSKRRESRICVAKIIHIFESKRLMFQGSKDKTNQNHELFDSSELLKNAMFDAYQNAMVFYGEDLNQKDNQSSRSRFDLKYIENVCETVLFNLKSIDQNIASFLKGRWTMSNIDTLIKSICRCAAAECILNRDEIVAEKYQPRSEDVALKSRNLVKIISGEYTNTAAFFFADQPSKIGFVNGVVDSIAKSYKKA